MLREKEAKNMLCRSCPWFALTGYITKPLSALSHEWVSKWESESERVRVPWLICDTRVTLLRWLHPTLSLLSPIWHTGLFPYLWLPERHPELWMDNHHLKLNPGRMEIHPSSNLSLIWCFHFTREHHSDLIHQCWEPRSGDGQQAVPLREHHSGSLAIQYHSIYGRGNRAEACGVIGQRTPKRYTGQWTENVSKWLKEILNMKVEEINCVKWKLTWIQTVKYVYDHICFPPVWMNEGNERKVVYLLSIWG